MARKPKPAGPVKQTVPPVLDVHHAPIIYFDEAPNFGAAHGIINVTIATYRNLPDGRGGIATDLVVVGHLRCNVGAAMALRKAIDDALLISRPAQGQPN